MTTGRVSSKTERGRETRVLTVNLKDGSGRPITTASRVVVAADGEDGTPVNGGGRMVLRGRGRAGEVSSFTQRLAAGIYVVEARAEGFEPAAQTVKIDGDGDLICGLSLLPQSPEGGDEDETETIAGRFAWFVDQRARRDGTFPSAARQRALDQKRRMHDPELTNAQLSVKRAKNPLPNASLCSLERFMRVSARKGQSFRRSLLKIPYVDDDLGWVDATTIRLFHFDDRARRLRLVAESGVDVARRYVYGYVDAPGVYGIIGLPGDPGVLQTVRSFCNFRGQLFEESQRGDHALHQRICQLVLCAPERRAKSAAALPTPPGRMEANVCEQCLGLEIPELGLPECDLLPHPPPGPIQPGCNWLSIGPRNINGRIRAITIHPTDGNTVFAGSANAGVWMTRDAGQSWAPLMHDEGALEIGALAAHLTDPASPGGNATIYAGTGEPTWWPGYKGIGILKSSASGAPGTWALTGALPAPGNDRFSAIVVDPTSVTANPASTILYAGGTPGGLYKSTNGGATWTSILSKNITGLTLDPVDPTIVYAAVAFEGIYRFDPVANAWNLFNTGLATPFPQLILIAIGESAPHTMYAKLDQTVYKYDSVAASWLSLGNHGGTTYGYWNNVLAVDPQDSNIVFAGGIGFERSFDGGTTWQGIPGLHSDQHALVFDSSNHLNVYAGNDGGIYLGTYPAASSAGTWTKVSDGLIVTAFNQLGVFTSGDVMGGGAQDNGTNRTVGGLTWDNIFGADGGFLVIDPDNPYVMWAEIQGGGWLSKTTDGGASWNPANGGFPGGPWVTPIVLDPTSPADPNRVLFAGGSSAVYRTTTSGTSWGPSSPNTGGAVQAIALASSSSAVVYAGTDTGRVWRSSDGGATTGNWKEITAGTIAGSAALPSSGVTDIAVDPTNPDAVYVVYSAFGTGHVFRGTSTDGWATWRWDDISANLPDVPVNAIQADPVAVTTFYIGTDIGVFRTTDGGLSWNDFGAGLPNVVVSDLAVDTAGELLRAATYGYGVWELHLRAMCTDVDVYVRDNVLDTGENLPSPSGVADPEELGRNVYWWESADIKVDAYPYFPVDALFDGVEFDLSTAEDVVRNDALHPNPNRLYVQVHNRGPNVAHNANVKALYADASAGLPALPADFWASFPNDWAAPSAWTTVDPAVPFQNIPDLLPHTPKVISWSWTVPVMAAAHTCMLVVVSTDEDPVAHSDANPNDHLPWMVVPNDKHITLRNLHVITAPAPPLPRIPIIATIDLHNPLPYPEFFDLALDHSRFPGRATISVLLPRVETLVPADRLLRREDGKFSRISGQEWWWKGAKGQLAKRGWRFRWTVDVRANEGERIAHLPGILVSAKSKLTAAIVVELPRTIRPGAVAHLTLVQRQNGTVLGGSTFEIRVPPREVTMR